jgi:hypothetical protein
MSEHQILRHWFGKEVEGLGTIVHAFTMLHPNNDVFVIKGQTGQPRRMRRVEVFGPIDELTFKESDR